jgi:hypothetical protein
MGDKKALLRLIYLVRCNLFHGEKAHHPIQATLLTSSAKIVDRVCRELLNWIEVRAKDPVLSPTQIDQARRFLLTKVRAMQRT